MGNFNKQWLEYIDYSDIAWDTWWEFFSKEVFSGDYQKLLN